MEKTNVCSVDRKTLQPGYKVQISLKRATRLTIQLYSLTHLKFGLKWLGNVHFIFQNDHDLMMAFKGNVKTFWLVSKEGFAPLDSDYSAQDLADKDVKEV